LTFIKVSYIIYSCEFKTLILDPLAQSAEHLTFNQGVPRSNRGWVTILYAGVAQSVEQLIRNQ
jgi:hypothetical protein